MLKYVLPLLITVTASAALAEPVDAPTPSVRVSYADLDLVSAEGRVVLDRRLRAAAGQVCPGRNSFGLTERLAARACAKGALRSARRLAASTIASKRVLLASAEPKDGR